MHFDLCLPWYWEYDIDFVQFVEHACNQQGLALWQITPNDLLESITELYQGEKTFRTILDRSQYDPRFEPVHRWSRQHHVRRINPAEVSAWSEDKATMHLELINAGIHTPYTILLSPFIEQPVLPHLDLMPLGNQFVIKPSNGGGGEGVILGAFSIDQILRARMEFPAQKYLIQATITPRTIHGQPTWFRVFYAVGKTYPCWWHPLTHVFSIVTQQDEHKYELSPLHEITQRIASICKLDWFSTEIALTLEEFVVVDYVNDGIDTRVQSKAVDGVPDEVMQNIAEQLVKIAKGETHDARA
jgi:glutathione synthase/RimK-type ligase-like ATP-grasp enzyme